MREQDLLSMVGIAGHQKSQIKAMDILVDWGENLVLADFWINPSFAKRKRTTNIQRTRSVLILTK
jgi:hypothetical protein